MSDKEKELRNLLLRSFDKDLSEKEVVRLEDGLRTSATLRQEQRQLTELRKQLQDTEYTFGPFFTRKVMNRIAALDTGGIAENAFNYLLGLYSRRLVVSGVSLALLILAYIFVQEGTVSLDALFGFEDLPEELITDYYIGE